MRQKKVTKLRDKKSVKITRQKKSFKIMRQKRYKDYETKKVSGL